MEIRIIKDWEMTNGNSTVQDYESEIWFDFDNIAGFAVEGTAILYKTVNLRKVIDPIIVSLRDFEVHKDSGDGTYERVIDYPVELVNKIKEGIIYEL